MRGQINTQQDLKLQQLKEKHSRRSIGVEQKPTQTKGSKIPNNPEYIPKHPRAALSREQAIIYNKILTKAKEAENDGNYERSIKLVSKALEIADDDTELYQKVTHIPYKLREYDGQKGVMDFGVKIGRRFVHGDPNLYLFHK
ncbi:MAG: hypothetical protein EZS28_030155 [Streblomastix strix]|uniref:Uncharacterized protein n=1 Tax=Streblomastix strix TaxID=222440 RepID=A0A5J4UV56_9EUKA|nr:MAG: hypothetical protein EZS28_030155 [Streblomastix strix]